MNLDIGPAWEKINSLINGAIAILPNLVLAIVMFAVTASAQY